MISELFFLIKKIVNAAATPVFFSLVLMALGGILALRKQGAKLRWWLIAAAFLTLALFSFDLVPNSFIAPLEYSYQPLLDTDDLPRIGWVVVLGGGHRSDSSLPLTSQMGAGTLARLVEGIRLHRLLPGSRLILSGGRVFDLRSNAELMAEMAVALGVDRADLLLEDESRDTAGQARILKPILGEDTFLLVTSAFHMPRAVFLFERAGLKPIPAPVGHLTHPRSGWSFFRLFPSSLHIRKAETAWREYLGLLWERFVGGAD